MCRCSRSLRMLRPVALTSSRSGYSVSKRSMRRTVSWRPTRPAERWSSFSTPCPANSLERHMPKSVAIVTGASQGIGRATSVRLARDFSALVLVARNRANLEETAEAVKAAGAQIKAAGAQILVIDADLGQPAAAQSVVDEALAAFGRIDALLNIAGAVPQVDLFEMSDAHWGGGLEL